MNTKIKYQVKNGFFDLSFFWKLGSLSLSDTAIVINGDCNYIIPFAKITKITRYLPRMGAGLYIIIQIKGRTFLIRVPNSTILSGTTNSDTEELYQLIRSKTGNRIGDD